MSIADTSWRLAVVVIGAMTEIALAAPTPAQKCAAAKLKATTANVARKASCHRKALSASAPVKGGCLAKAAKKLAAAYAKAEAKGGCAGSGDADDVASNVDACLASIVGAIGGDAKCATAKLKAAGKSTMGELRCHRTATATGSAVSSGCLDASATKLTRAVEAADARGSCAGTAEGLVALVETCVATLVGDEGAECALQQNTSPTATVHPGGCAVLSRDTTSCEPSRMADGLSGHWLKFSCRVTLSRSGSGVTAQADGQPDYKSNYFSSTDACYEAYTGGVQNPNRITVQHYTLTFPATPDTTAQSMSGTAIVGLALNGVPIFGNFAAPGDDIFREARTFDRCGAHPQNTGKYHYHGEPYAISYDDASFIGVMRDGYPVYGRKDPDGTLPTLDAYGGHVGVTFESPSTPVYHHHVNEQTSTNPGTAGETQWFLTTGTFRGTPGACSGCN